MILIALFLFYIIGVFCMYYYIPKMDLPIDTKSERVIVSVFWPILVWLWGIMTVLRIAMDKFY